MRRWERDGEGLLREVRGSGDAKAKRFWEAEGRVAGDLQKREDRVDRGYGERLACTWA